MNRFCRLSSSFKRCVCCLSVMLLLNMTSAGSDHTTNNSLTIICHPPSLEAMHYLSSDLLENTIIKSADKAGENVTIDNLPPGDYLLRVRGMLSSWSDCWYAGCAINLHSNKTIRITLPRKKIQLRVVFDGVTLNNVLNDGALIVSRVEEIIDNEISPHYRTWSFFERVSKNVYQGDLYSVETGKYRIAFFEQNLSKGVCTDVFAVTIDLDDKDFERGHVSIGFIKSEAKELHGERIRASRPQHTPSPPPTNKKNEQ